MSSRVPPAVYYIRIAFFAHVSCCQCRHQSDPSGSLPPPAASIPSLLLQVKPQLKMACSRLQIASNKKTALMKQQIKFAEAKAAEMQTQYERTVQRYEDRIKIDKDEMQRELKDRSQRLLEEKEAAEAKY